MIKNWSHIYLLERKMIYREIFNCVVDLRFFIWLAHTIFVYSGMFSDQYFVIYDCVIEF